VHAFYVSRNQFSELVILRQLVNIIVLVNIGNCRELIIPVLELGLRKWAKGMGVPIPHFGWSTKEP